MGETKNEVYMAMKRLADNKVVIIEFNEFMQEFIKRINGSDAINDEVTFKEETFRISSIQMFDGKATLHLSIAGGAGSVGVSPGKEGEAGEYEVPYNEAITLKPDETNFAFLRWEGANAAEVVDNGGHNFSLMMDTTEKSLVAVFNTEPIQIP
ncbi:MAG: hypothetical protein KKA07_06670 [Bacteroidetes bacterium]|nr:hypothetical protein [Bacteroidota bacterium]